jgi:hypothetical protein
MPFDGFVAGPNQSAEHPIGEDGMRLHQWVLGTASWREQHGKEGGDRTPDSDIVDEVVEGVDAYVMGRRMFGGGDGPWDETWTSWWDEDPPFHRRSSCSPTRPARRWRCRASPAVIHVEYDVVR